MTENRGKGNSAKGKEEQKPVTTVALDRVCVPAKLVSTTMDFRAFVAKAPHLTIPRQRTLANGGKFLFSNADAKIPKAISQKRQMDFHF